VFPAASPPSSFWTVWLSFSSFFLFFFCSISKHLRIPGKISDKGVLAPYAPHVYEPIVELLEKENVKVVDEILDL